MTVIKIFSNAEDLTEGIYGQCLCWLLEVIYYLEKHNIHNINDENTKVIFDINTLNNKNLIPKFIQPKKIYDIDKSFEPIEISLKEYKIKNKIGSLPLNVESFEKTNKIFNKYFKFNDFIIDEINKMNINSKTLGVHYRGTDKNYDTNQANFLTIKEMILFVKDYMENNDIEQIFCCSDEQSFINEIDMLYPNKVIEFKQLRSNISSTYGFFRNGHRQNSNMMDKLTYSCIIDMLALSKCATIIKTSSALSSFSKILNPSLKLYTVSAMKRPWFPAAVAERYKSESEEIMKILKRTMINDAYNKF